MSQGINTPGGAEHMRERQNMKDAGVGRSLADTTFRYECRICGADHGRDRLHTPCPECGLEPREFYDGPWAESGRFGTAKPDDAQFPFRTDTSWTSKRAEIIDEE